MSNKIREMVWLRCHPPNIETGSHTGKKGIFSSSVQSEYGLAFERSLGVLENLGSLGLLSDLRQPAQGEGPSPGVRPNPMARHPNCPHHFLLAVQRPAAGVISRWRSQPPALNHWTQAGSESLK